MAQPDINIGLTCNVFVRQMHFINAGDVELGHTHPFDHLSLLAKGSVNIKVDGVSTEFTAPHMIWIRADKNHEITATSNNTVVYCIHGLRDTAKSDDIIDPTMVPTGVLLRQLISNTVNSV